MHSTRFSALDATIWHKVTCLAFQNTAVQNDTLANWSIYSMCYVYVLPGQAKGRGTDIAKEDNSFQMKSEKTQLTMSSTLG